MLTKIQKKHKAFSLIELSIVVLIIAILIIGITQGSILIKSSKLSSAQSLTKGSPVATINNLVLWLEPTLPESFKNQDDRFDIEDGDSISAWIDINPRATNKISIDQAIIANQPKYVTNGVNDLPSVRFDYTNDDQRLIKANVMAGRNIETTYFIVLKWSNSHDVNGQIFGFGSNVGGHYIYILPTAALGAAFYNNNTAENEGVTQTTANYLRSGGTFILTQYFSPAKNSAKLYLNHDVIDDIEISTPPVTTGIFDSGGPGIVIGNHEIAPRTIGADIAEIIVYDRALKNSEIKDIQDYLTKKYGIK